MTDSPLVRPVEHDPESDIYRAQYDWSSAVPLTTVIVEIIAEIDQVDPRDVDRLYKAIDPEALDRLFIPLPTATRRDGGQVSFVLETHEVLVHGTGEIVVRPDVR